MPKIELPVADAAGSACSLANADRATCAPLDWRQVSHELRTPLNAILGNTELLLDGSSGPLSAQARACLGEVQTAGRQLLRQIQLLLAWSELSVSVPRLVESQVDVIALLREGLATGRPGAAQVNVEPHDARLIVRGDRSSLRMLVAEVIALNGAPGAAPTIRCETGAGGSAVRFAWPGFCAAQAGALQIALIETIAWQQGADLAVKPDGLALLWPLRQPDRPQPVGSTCDPSERSRGPA
jgi:hypothetical protein